MCSKFQLAVSGDVEYSEMRRLFRWQSTAIEFKGLWSIGEPHVYCGMWCIPHVMEFLCHRRSPHQPAVCSLQVEQTSRDLSLQQQLLVTRLRLQRHLGLHFLLKTNVHCLFSLRVLCGWSVATLQFHRNYRGFGIIIIILPWEEFWMSCNWLLYLGTMVNFCLSTWRFLGCRNGGSNVFVTRGVSPAIGFHWTDPIGCFLS